MEIQPKDPSKNHFYVSLVKSAVRVACGVSLFKGAFAAAGVFLIVAEVLGIVEEVV